MIENVTGKVTENVSGNVTDIVTKIQIFNHRTKKRISILLIYQKRRRKE